MQWHYDDVEAERVGHPWQTDATWGNTNYLSEFGELIAVSVFCLFAAVGMLLMTIAVFPIWVYRKLRSDI